MYMISCNYHGPQVLVPRADEGQNNVGDKHRFGHGHHYAENLLNLVTSVHIRAFQYGIGNVGHVLTNEKHAEHVDDTRQNKTPYRVVEPHIHYKYVVGYHQHFARHHHCGQQQCADYFFAAETHLGKHVAHYDCDKQADCRKHYRDKQSVE